MPRANILGVGVHAVDMSAAVRLIANAIAARRQGYVCLTGVHGIMEAQRDLHFGDVMAEASLVLPDGMPTVWIGRIQGLRQMKRVFGPDLMLAVMAHPEFAPCSHFLLGGKPGVAEELGARLQSLFPNIRIVGHYAPPFRSLNPAEDLELSRLVAKAKPDITWIGLSTPKQELFMARYLGQLNTTLMIGVGAAFDFHTGRLKDSPHWLKALGLQWLHRLLQEPNRLWKRYLYNNSLFVWKICLQLLGIHRYTLPLMDSSARGSSQDPARMFVQLD